jgi:hypothetical protein
MSKGLEHRRVGVSVSRQTNPKPDCPRPPELSWVQECGPWLVADTFSQQQQGRIRPRRTR